MGYYTDLSGELTIEPPLNEHETSFLKDFTSECHMTTVAGPLNIATLIEAGADWRTRDALVTDINTPPEPMPGLSCPITVDDDGERLIPDESDKPYDVPQWIAFLVDRLLSPNAREFIDANLDDGPRLVHFTCDHTVSGEIYGDGEDSDDYWRVSVENNKVFFAQAEQTFPAGIALN